MKIEDKKVVKLSYQLEVEGKIADKADSSAPLEYIQGMHMLLPKFEAEVAGKQTGDSFEFTLSPEEGYGVYNPKFKFPIPIESFSDSDGNVRRDLLQVGNIIPLMDTSGQVHQAKVVEVNDTEVTMDFNHPMAGKTLHFTGKVEDVREATEKELKEGLHGEFLPQEECSCGCGHHHEDGECNCGHHHDGGSCGCGGHGDCGEHGGCGCSK